LQKDAASKNGARPKGVIPGHSERSAAEKLVAKLGEKGAADDLAISTNTLMRILGGRPVHRASLVRLQTMTEGTDT
jgi:hypothetical protein